MNQDLEDLLHVKTLPFSDSVDPQTILNTTIKSLELEANNRKVGISRLNCNTPRWLGAKAVYTRQGKEKTVIFEYSPSLMEMQIEVTYFYLDEVEKF